VCATTVPWPDDALAPAILNRADVLEEMSAALLHWGWKLQWSSRSLSLSQAPVVAGETLDQPAQVWHYVCQLQSGGGWRHRCKSTPPPVPVPFEEVLASKACRGAIMFGDELSADQCQALVRRLARCRFPLQCGAYFRCVRCLSIRIATDLAGRRFRPTIALNHAQPTAARRLFAWRLWVAENEAG
jgi:DNA mismatch repair ATPase MutL